VARLGQQEGTLLDVPGNSSGAPSVSMTTSKWISSGRRVQLEKETRAFISTSATLPNPKRTTLNWDWLIAERRKSFSAKFDDAIYIKFFGEIL